MFYLILTFSLLIIWLFQSQLYKLKSRKKIPKEYIQKLFELGKKSIETYDVPVGAIIVYNNEIIGEGFNTVNKNKNLSCHAEINAINIAINKFGDDFFKLDRKNLMLYSSYEPCEMCKGAIVHYNIRKVYFEGKKPIKMQLKSTLKEAYYEVFKRSLNAQNIQLNLFLKHPNYRKHHKID